MEATTTRIQELNEKIDAIWEQQRLAGTLLGYPKAKIEEVIARVKNELEALIEIATVIEKRNLDKLSVQDIVTYFAMAYGLNRNVNSNKLNLAANYIERQVLLDKTKSTAPTAQVPLDANPTF